MTKTSCRRLLWWSLGKDTMSGSFLSHPATRINLGMCPLASSLIRGLQLPAYSTSIYSLTRRFLGVSELYYATSKLIEPLSVFFSFEASRSSHYVVLKDENDMDADKYVIPPDISTMIFDRSFRIQMPTICILPLSCLRPIYSIRVTPGSFVL